MKRRLLVLNVLSTVCMAVAWILGVAAIAHGEWSSTEGSTSSSSAIFGAFSFTQSVGLFQTYSTRCCLVHGSAVPEMGITSCSLTDNRCQRQVFVSAKYCSFVNAEVLRLPYGAGSISCQRVQAGIVAVILLSILFLVILNFVVLGLFLAKKIGCGVFAVMLIPSVLGTLLSLVLYSVLVNQEIEAFFAARYAEAQSPSQPFVCSHGISYDIFVASFVFQVIALACAILRWVLRPLRVVQPPVELPDYTTEPVEPSFMMTPDINEMMGQPPKNRPPAVVGGAAMLPLCPNDFNCPFADKFDHQLEYSHTCRDFHCADYSTAHRQHFLHHGHATTRTTLQLEAPPPDQQHHQQQRFQHRSTSSTQSVSREAVEPIAAAPPVAPTARPTAAAPPPSHTSASSATPRSRFLPPTNATSGASTGAPKSAPGASATSRQLNGGLGGSGMASQSSTAPSSGLRRAPSWLQPSSSAAGPPPLGLEQ